MLLYIQRDDEINSLNKKIQQVENDLDTTTENLSSANTNLESANKQVQEVGTNRNSLFGLIEGGLFFLNEASSFLPFSVIVVSCAPIIGNIPHV